MKNKKTKIGSIDTFDRNLSRKMAKIYSHEISGLFDSFDMGYLTMDLDIDLEDYRKYVREEYTWKIKQLQNMTTEQRDRYRTSRRLALDKCLVCGSHITYIDDSGLCSYCIKSAKNQ